MKVLLTGSSKGIGFNIAKTLINEGHDIALHYNKNKSELDALLKDSKTNSFTIQSDLSDSNQIKDLVNSTIDKLSFPDCIINNAGISSVTAVDDENYENYWDDTLNVVLTGQIRLIRAALPHLLKSDNGRIVNISSTEGFGASPFHSPYTAAKHGVIGLTRSLALELGPKGVTVNCICPGPINTNMTSAIDEKDKATYARRRVGLKRYGEPEEVAHATLNLCLPSSSYINGVYLPVDGGLSIRRA